MYVLFKTMGKCDFCCCCSFVFVGFVLCPVNLSWVYGNEHSSFEQGPEALRCQSASAACFTFFLLSISTDVKTLILYKFVFLPPKNSVSCF